MVSLACDKESGIAGKRQETPDCGQGENLKFRYEKACLGLTRGKHDGVKKVFIVQV